MNPEAYWRKGDTYTTVTRQMLDKIYDLPIHIRYRMRLSLLLRAIAEKTNGRTPSQSTLVQLMIKKHSWGNRTTLKNLKTLEGLGLISSAKDKSLFPGYSIAYRLVV